MIKIQGYLAGFAFSLFLAAYIAMMLLNVYPGSGLLWRANLAFAREIRPLLEHIQSLAGGSILATILWLSGLAALSVAAAQQRMRLLAAGVCHIALAMVFLVVFKSFDRISGPRGLWAALNEPALFAASLSVSQYAMIGLALILAASCLHSHVSVLSHAFAFRKRQAKHGYARLKQ